MVRKILTYFHKEISGLHQAAYLLAIFAFLSQVLALVRDRLLAHWFGAGPDLDLYYAAFRIPDLLFTIIASTVSLSVLIPALIEKLERGREEAKDFIDDVFTFFALVMVVTCAAAYVAMPALSRYAFPGIADNAALVELSRTLLLSPVILGISNLLGSITQAHRRFFAYAASPLLYNAGIIAGILLLAPLYGVRGVVIGVIAGALLHLAVQLPFVTNVGFLPSLKRRVSVGSVKKVLLMSLPRTVALGASQFAALVLLSLASLLATGSIAIFNLSLNLQSVPLSIVGVSYSLAAFPTLAKFFSEGNRKEFLRHVVTSGRHIIFWSIPVSALFVVLRAHIVRVILGSGEFGWNETRLTAAALGIFVLSVTFQGLTLLITRGFYSTGQTKKPLVISILGAALSVAFALALLDAFNSYPMWRFFIEALFRVDGLEGTEVLMLPLGYTLGAMATGMTLWAFFQRDFPGFSAPLLRTLYHSLSASVILGFVTYHSLALFGLAFDNRTFIGIFLQGFSAGLTGIAAGIALLWLLRNEEIREIWGAFHKKFWKAKPVSPDTTVSS